MLAEMLVGHMHLRVIIWVVVEVQEVQDNKEMIP
jgi:hypothetical protein